MDLGIVKCCKYNDNGNDDETNGEKDSLRAGFVIVRSPSLRSPVLIRRALIQMEVMIWVEFVMD